MELGYWEASAEVCCAQLCKSFFFELDRHLHEVLAPRLDELGMIRHGSAWPAPPHGYSIDLDEAPIRKRMTRSN